MSNEENFGEKSIDAFRDVVAVLHDDLPVRSALMRGEEAHIVDGVIVIPLGSVPEAHLAFWLLAPPKRVSDAIRYAASCIGDEPAIKPWLNHLVSCPRDIFTKSFDLLQD